MYTSIDLSILESNYFIHQNLQRDFFVVTSRVTKNTWRVVQSIDGFYRLFLRLPGSNSFKFRNAYGDIAGCLLDIADFEEKAIKFILSEKHMHSYFDEWLSKYNSI